MNRAGEMVRNLSGSMAYLSFRPAPLPPEPPLELHAETIALLGKANRDLGRLDASACLIPSVDLFVSMYVRKEALISSQIEGTQCTLDDVLDPDVDTNANLEVADVVNYIRAAQFSVERMKSLPLCNRLLREAHAELLRGVRGMDKEPGEFRRSQNWIGPAGCTLADARYVPPNGEDMEQAMSDLERYINEEREQDPLVRAALIHYQFETIHPFLDGNGRIGRLLILLYFLDQKLLTKPVLYVSYFLKKNQVEYYDRMGEVRRSGNYEQWVAFFLEAVSSAAEDALDTIGKLSKLHDKNVALLPASGKGSANLRAIFDYTEQHPILSIRGAAQALGLSFNTVSSGVRKLVDLGFLEETTSAARNRVFACGAYLDILRPGT